MDSKLEKLTGTLREHGYRLTGARRAILEELLRCSGHLTADELEQALNRSDPQVGRMTVYRTLDLLQQLGLIRPVYQGTGAAHYVLLDEGHHHHLLCSGCAAVIEVEECGIRELEAQLQERFQFDIQGHLLEFYGLCPKCQEDGR